MIPHVLSSSDTAENTILSSPGNTAIQRKSFSRHTLVAEATKATGKVMMKEMTLCSHEIERSKMEIQLKLFVEQTEYQREKDRRIHKNAKLSIIKQGEVVECVSRLAAALTTGMQCNSTTVQEVPSVHGCSLSVQEKKGRSPSPICPPSTSEAIATDKNDHTIGGQ